MAELSAENAEDAEQEETIVQSPAVINQQPSSATESVDKK